MPLLPEHSPSEVTQLLQQAGRGDRSAMQRLAPLVYDELRNLAGRALRNRPPGQTLRTTALVHEAYVKLIDQTQVKWESRAQFFTIAAHAMRSVLVDYLPRKGAAKRGGDHERIPLEPD